MLFCGCSIATEHLVKVKQELGHFAPWKELGLNLGLSPALLEVIETKQTVSERLYDVLLEWLKRNYSVLVYGLPSWHQLAGAVDPINHALATDIRKNHSE